LSLIAHAKNNTVHLGLKGYVGRTLLSTKFTANNSENFVSFLKLFLSLFNARNYNIFPFIFVCMRDLLRYELCNDMNENCVFDDE
jgi:hypothetical protein